MQAGRMQAGRMDRRVTFRKLVETQSASGAVVLTPQAVATVWAQKEYESGTENFQGGQAQGWSAVLWRTRFFRGASDEPTVKWEIVEGLRIYDVLEVREIGRREGWEFVARTRSEDQVA